MLKYEIVPAESAQGGSPAAKPDTGTLSSQRRNILLMGTATFFFWAAMYLYVPILPLYARSMGASLSMVGIIVAAFALPQLLLRIPLGIWSDNLGRRKPLIIGGVFMVFLGAVGMVVAPNPWFVALARGAVGVGAAIWVIITVYFVSFYPAEDTSKPVGILFFINSGALVVASLAGGMIAETWGAPLTFYGAALLGIIALVAVWFSGESKALRSETISWKGFARIAGRRLPVVVAIMGILQLFAQFSGVLGFIPVYAHEIGASETEIGIVTMLAMVSAMIGALAMTHLVRRWGYRLTVVTASILMGLPMLAVPLVRTVPVLDAVQFAHGLGRGVLSATLMTLSLYGVAPQQRATAMGFFQASYSIGMLFGPLMSGFLADRYGLAIIFYLSGALVLAVAGMACLHILPGRDDTPGA